MSSTVTNPGPGKLNLEVLDQREVWIDRHGVEHRISDMSPRYCLNVYRFLMRRATLIELRKSLHESHMWPSEEDMSDGVFGAYSQWLSEAHARADNPDLWLKSKPLLQRLLARSHSGVTG